MWWHSISSFTTFLESFSGYLSYLFGYCHNHLAEDYKTYWNLKINHKLLLPLQPHVLVRKFIEQRLHHIPIDTTDGVLQWWFQFVDNCSPILVDKRIHWVRQHLVTIKKIIHSQIHSRCVEVNQNFVDVQMLSVIFLLIYVSFDAQFKVNVVYNFILRENIIFQRFFLV